MLRILLLCFLLPSLLPNVLSKMCDEDINMVLPAQQLFHTPNYVQDPKYLGIFNNCICQESPEVFVYCYGDNCKDFPIISIDVVLFKLKLSSVVVIKRNDLRLLSGLKGLEIEGNIFLKTIEPGCFKQMNLLENLTITNNYMLEYLEENVFEGLVNLTILSLTKNGFKRVIDATTGLSTKHVPSLQLLDLSQNIVHSIQRHEFHYMNGTGLQELSLYLCGIVYIHPQSLQPFQNLTILRIGQNSCNKEILTKLVVNTIKYAPNLDLLNLLSSDFRKIPPMELLEAVGQSNITDVILARSHFDEITDESFPIMKQILTMDLRECNINSVSDDAFSNLSNMTVLLLNCNRLTTVPLGVVVPKLIILDLGGNSLRGNSQDENYFYIPDRVFENMTNLDNLQLCYNNIQYITRYTFFGLSNLTSLNLKSTQLNYIEDGSFVHLKNLLHLNLNKNPLLVLNSETFRGLPTVNTILLANCGLKNLTAKPGILHHLKNVTYLGLYNNEIQTISPDQLTHLYNLDMIHLENNKLTTWNVSILPRKNYSEIIFSQNKFTYVTEAMLQDFQFAIILFLDGNPFRCDCSLYPTVQWLRKHHMSVNYTKQTNFIAKCDSPDEWRRISFVEFLKVIQFQFICDPIIGPYQIVAITLSSLLLITLFATSYIFRWHIKYWIFLIRLTIMKKTIQKPTESISYQYDAFVSYSVEDKHFVTQLCNNLEPFLKLCIFERDFPPGSTISQAILTAVASSRRTLLVVSESFARSSWCRWETQIAQFHQIFFRGDSSVGPDDTLVLVKLEDVINATPILRYLLKTRIYLEWNQDKQFWDKLKYTLSRPKV